MARKKRADPAAVLRAARVSEPADGAALGYSTAAYVRLSMEDSGKTDGYSLQNQEQLLLDFIQEHPDLRLYKLYVDNGYTGTKFSRPAFDEMMQDMRAGRINCIVVKDLSRLGRNYLEAGNYLEQIFPFFKVRFISITDGYDSNSPHGMEEALIIPLKNMINEGYARDISLKVSSALAARKRQGKFMGKVPLYGYLKDPDDKNHLVVDPEASLVVQRVFQMKLDGVSPGAIAKQMNEEGVPCPSKYFVLKGLSKETKYLNSFWDRNTAKRMLTNRMYLGCIVYGKSVHSFAKGLNTHNAPSDEWNIVEDTHEPLVTEEVFARVQELLAASSRQAKNHASYAEAEVPNLFRGIIHCADCGGAMRMGKFRKPKKDAPEEYRYYGLYECCRHKLIYEHSCPKKSIRKDTLDAAVEEAIRYHIRMFLDLEKVVAGSEKRTSPRKVSGGKQALIREKQRRIAKVEKLSCGIYEDYQDGVLSEAAYLNLRKSYAEEVTALTGEVNALLQAQAHDAESRQPTDSLSALAHKYRDFPVLTREIVETFVSDVKVHTGGRLTITFRFEDAFAKLQQRAEDREEEAS